MFSGRLGGWRDPLVILRLGANAGFAGLDPNDRKRLLSLGLIARGSLHSLKSSLLARSTLLQLLKGGDGLASLTLLTLLVDVFDDVTDTESFPLQKVS